MAASPAPAQPAQPPARVASGEQLHFDALERQINDALVRLSLSEEAVAASLRQAAASGGVAAEAQAGAAGGGEAAQADAGAAVAQGGLTRALQFMRCARTLCASRLLSALLKQCRHCAASTAALLPLRAASAEEPASPCFPYKRCSGAVGGCQRLPPGLAHPLRHTHPRRHAAPAGCGMRPGFTALQPECLLWKVQPSVRSRGSVRPSWMATNGWCHHAPFC